MLDLYAGDGEGKPVSEMAFELKTEIGRNSVPFTTVSERGHIDLAGKGHFDKSTGATIPTPHVQSRSIHRGSEGQTNLGPEVTRPATKQDIRMARELEKRRD